MKNIDNKKTPISNKKKLLIPLTLLMALTAGTLSSFRNITFDSLTGHVTVDLNWFKLALIFLLSWMTVSIHLSKSVPGTHYMRQVLCGPSQKGRVCYLDYIRVTATVLVIATHTISAAADQLEAASLPWFILELFSFLFHSCNLLFVLVSGALLLNNKEEDLSSFYIKRVAKVAIPMVLYYLSYLVILNGSAALKPSNWKNIINDILLGSPNVPHFWLIYIILFLYIITPLLRRLLKNQTDQTLYALTFALLAFNGLATYLPLSGVTLNFPIRILPWITVFITGYLLRQIQDSRYATFILAGGLLSLIISLLLILRSASYPAQLYNTAPTMVLIGSSLFLILKKHYQNRNSVPPLLACISRYSFSILLIHWYILFYIVGDKLHISGLSFHIAGGVTLTVIITLVLSLIFSILFDNTVVLCADYLFQKICHPLTNHSKSDKSH